MQNLKNKTVVITGGASGIGFATAKELTEKKAKVIITGRQKDSVEKASKEIGAIGIVSDQSDLIQIESLVKNIAAQFEKIDALFINAGIAAFAPVSAISEEHYDTIMDINFKGALFTLQKFMPLLNDGASVIFLSSINAHNAMENTAVYAASKAALNALAKVAAIELAPRGIRVNTVSPGPVNTPLWGKVGMNEEQLSQTAALIQSKVPLKKFGSSEEIAKTVVFLTSDDSSYTTGAEFIVDGGFNLNTLVG
ncbi:MAG: SDR family oxidoreductase [Ignavibacterium album]|jgi:NAD(P)-dependent dehydrogenase (short-subunit alcohol dehydrogenase family)|uniref:SDR family oxidoreductase n=1 Tax=Ignavibacterium album TaxID=591197 RepID=UPI0026F12152|nr:SDR family oxidoreductase [Ignavibacterium album]MBI5661738.1 SDR family oxidoreductase [Ignavibacterium album]